SLSNVPEGERRDMSEPLPRLWRKHVADRPDVAVELEGVRLLAGQEVRARRALPRIEPAREIARRKPGAGFEPQARRSALPEPPLEFQIGVAEAGRRGRLAAARDVDVVGRAKDQIDRLRHTVAQLGRELEIRQRHVVDRRARVLRAELQLESALALRPWVVGDVRMST